MKFKNLEEAKSTFINAVKKHTKASLAGGFKDANRSFTDEIDPAMNYIKESGGLASLKPLLKHEDIGVIVFVAKYLLPIYEEECIKLLVKVRDSNIKHHSLNAKYLLLEWSNGNSKN